MNESWFGPVGVRLKTKDVHPLQVEQHLPNKDELRPLQLKDYKTFRNHIDSHKNRPFCVPGVNKFGIWEKCEIQNAHIRRKLEEYEEQNRLVQEEKIVPIKQRKREVDLTDDAIERITKLTGELKLLQENFFHFKARTETSLKALQSVIQNQKAEIKQLRVLSSSTSRKQSSLKNIQPSAMTTRTMEDRSLENYFEHPMDVNDWELRSQSLALEWTIIVSKIKMCVVVMVGAGLVLKRYLPLRGVWDAGGCIVSC